MQIWQNNKNETFTTVNFIKLLQKALIMDCLEKIGLISCDTQYTRVISEAFYTMFP
jgi:hypothetical protein